MIATSPTAKQIQPMTKPNIAIDYVANCPELIEKLARLSWEEWQEVYQQRKQTWNDILKNYRGRMSTDRLPLTLVAVQRRPAGNCRGLVGVGSLKFHDMDTRPGLGPRLGGLFVLPQWGNHGGGTVAVPRAPEGA